MKCSFDKIIIDVNQILLNNDERKIQLIKKWLVDILTFAEEEKIKIMLVSSNAKARQILIDEIAEDIESKVLIQIFEKDDFNNNWSVWKLEKKINKNNSIVFVTSVEFINFLKNDNLFTIPLKVFDTKDITEKEKENTAYKKVIEISKILDELPNILFKLDSFLD